MKTKKSKKAVLDSNILIYISKGDIDLKNIVNEYDEIYISIITKIEVYGYKYLNQKEKNILDKIFSDISDIISIDTMIADIAIKYRLKKNIKISDCLILATAEHLGADLITKNVLDFRNITDNVKIIDPGG